MKRLSGLTAAIAILASTSAFAADAIDFFDPAPVAPAAPFDWTGGYIGLHGGHGWGDTHDKNNPAAESKDIDGWLGGIQAGYNWQLPSSFVFGIEGDLSFGSLGEEWTDSNVFSGYYTEDELTTVGTVRARLGYAAGNFLPYVTGGLAIGRTKHTLGCDGGLVTGGAGSCLSDPDREFHTSDSGTSVGYAVGVGGEYAFANNWSFKAEYLYTDLGKTTATLSDPAYPDLAERKFDTNFNTVRVGLNYRF